MTELPLPNCFGDPCFDNLLGESIEQYWCNETPHPFAGIFKYSGQWYVWPPKYWNRYDSDFAEELEEYLTKTLPYDNRYTAAIACLFRYRE